MFHRRLTVLWALVTLAMVVVGGRLFYLQVVRGSYYQERAENKISYKKTLETRRGYILDRTGAQLAVDETEYDVDVCLERLDGLKDRKAAWCEQFAKLVGMDPGEFASQVEDAAKRLEESAARFDEPRRTNELKWARRDFKHVLIGLDSDTVRRIELGQDRLPAFESKGKEQPVFQVQPVSRRKYPFGPLASHVIGYMGRVNDEELEGMGYRYQFDGTALKKFAPDDTIGRTGIEATYEAELRGARGMIFGIWNAAHQPIPSIPSALIEPVPGSDVHLTLDARVQRIAEEALDKQLHLLEANRHAEDPPLAGSVVIVDPATGDVLAAANAPRFDLNAVRWSSTFNQMLRDPRQVFLNRATLGRYPMGSVFKIVVATAGLETGALTGHTEFTCPGSFTSGDHVYRCTSTHGTVEMGRAIEQSCNVYFYNAGLAVGGTKLKEWAENYGLGSRTGSDIAEFPGHVPLAKDKASLLNLSIGQGTLLATPLQVARAMGCVALQGTLADSRFSLEKPVAVRHVAISDATLGVIRWGMHDVVEGARGTAAHNGRVAGLIYAGKTGTAQTPREGIFEAWFAGYAPFRQPKLAFACIVENTRGHGGTDATPVIREIFTRMMADPKLAAYLGGGEKE